MLEICFDVLFASTTDTSGEIPDDSSPGGKKQLDTPTPDAEPSHEQEETQQTNTTIGGGGPYSNRHRQPSWNPYDPSSAGVQNDRRSGGRYGVDLSSAGKGGIGAGNGFGTLAPGASVQVRISHQSGGRLAGSHGPGAKTGRYGTGTERIGGMSLDRRGTSRGSGAEGNLAAVTTGGHATRDARSDDGVTSRGGGDSAEWNERDNQDSRSRTPGGLRREGRRGSFRDLDSVGARDSDRPRSPRDRDQREARGRSRDRDGGDPQLPYGAGDGGQPRLERSISDMSCRIGGMGGSGGSSSTRYDERFGAGFRPGDASGIGGRMARWGGGMSGRWAPGNRAGGGRLGGRAHGRGGRGGGFGLEAGGGRIGGGGYADLLLSSRSSYADLAAHPSGSGGVRIGGVSCVGSGGGGGSGGTGGYADLAAIPPPRVGGDERRRNSSSTLNSGGGADDDRRRASSSNISSMITEHANADDNDRRRRSHSGGSEGGGKRSSGLSGGRTSTSPGAAAGAAVASRGSGGVSGGLPSDAGALASREVRGGKSPSGMHGRGDDRGLNEGGPLDHQGGKSGTWGDRERQRERIR